MGDCHTTRAPCCPSFLPPQSLASPASSAPGRTLLALSRRAWLLLATRPFPAPSTTTTRPTGTAAARSTRLHESTLKRPKQDGPAQRLPGWPPAPRRLNALSKKNENTKIIEGKKKKKKKKNWGKKKKKKKKKK